MGRAYYNEFDPGAAEWLRELIRAGLIAPGEVDERSILDVRADELSEFTQCHFFAGIGGWSYALRLAGWPDDRPVWTGSPPCQPFSAAGQGLSQDDPRHLAPHFVQLVGAARPAVLFGEQVASAEVFGPSTAKARSSANGQAQLWCEGCGGFHKASRPITDPECPHCGAESGFFDYSAATEGYDPDPKWAWLDDLQNRLEAAHYAVGASDIPAAGVGAPHIRQRTFFGAYDLRPAAGGLVNGIGSGLERHGRHVSNGNEPGRVNPEPNGSIGAAVPSCGVADPASFGQPQGRPSVASQERDGIAGNSTFSSMGHNGGTSPLDGFWANADWLGCRDGKWRPVEPGSKPLAHGVSGRVGQLRGYGNAICPQAAKEFIEAFEEVMQ